MATVSRGEITITNVDDGKPSYTHWAYAWSADGKDRFTTTYPGENLINLSTITLGKFVYWPGTGLTSNVSRAVTDYIPVKEGEQYTLSLSANDGFDFSFYLYKDNTSGISDLRYSGSAWQIPDTIGSTFGTPKTTLAIPTGYKYARVSFIKSSGTATAEVMKAIQPKMERGTVATPYAPAPSEDFENAYPTFAGSYVDDQPKDSEHPADYTWQRILGPGGKDGESAPLVSLSGATQAITVSKTGTVTPSSSFQVTGTAVNTTISTWTYSLNGGSFGSALPTGVTRSGNVVSVNPTTSTFDQLTIKADDGTVSDVFTISRITDGGDGNNGADAYTVFLTNESYTFAGSTSAALAGSTTTEVVVYKGINKITPTSVVVGTKPTGLSSSVSGSVVTFTAATTLVTKSGTVPITITVDGKTFTKQFAYALSLQGEKGDPTGIISQSTVPTDPYVGMLWQNTGASGYIIGATYRWTGSAWSLYVFTAENISATNLAALSAVLGTVSGGTITGSVFKTTFDRTDADYSGGVQTRKIGTGILQEGMLQFDAEIRSTDGVKQSHKLSTYDEQGFNQNRWDYNSSGTMTRQRWASFGEYGLQLVDTLYGSATDRVALAYQDLMKKPETAITESNASQFKHYSASDEHKPQASRNGRIVQLRGAFRNVNLIASGEEGLVMGTVPVWARPVNPINTIVQGTGANIYLLTVQPNGQLLFGRYRGDTGSANNYRYDYKDCGAGSWLNIACTYTAGDL